jgi:hypothetical protein
MRYQIYQLIHLVGVMSLFTGLAGLLWLRIAGVSDNGRAKRAGAIFHGIGMVLIVVAGFGMLAQLSKAGGKALPNWAIVKMVIWLVMGAGLMLIRKKGEMGWRLATLFILLGAFAGYLGLFKPF